MLLLLIRHAQAAQQDEARYPDDSLRPLVPKGRKIQRRMSKQLRRRNLVPARVFSSPWKRAWQTARIVVEETGLPREARLPCVALAGPPDLAAIGAEIGEIGPEETIALVGHEPWMSELASLLLSGRSAGLSVDFPKSGILGIEIAGISAESGAGTLRFFLVP
ncbi:MAG TPA: histidine phosphatase family protein [Gemmatimonadales bacterium]|jgi:phosphohistidine phosphatase|nr:histidine phosphatase family protein [Gemmatimonadales bacterium]